MPIICPYCKQDIPIKDYDAHLTESHPEAIIDRIRYTITKAKDQVDYVLQREPAARNNNGVLLQKVFKLFPINTARYVYSPSTKEIGLLAESYEDFIYAMKHAETITRLGRAWRKAHPEADQGSKPDERRVEYGFSTAYWAQHKGYTDKMVK